MQEIYRFIGDAIKADHQHYTDIADQIWDHPETYFGGFWPAEHLVLALESAGFTVTRNVGNIPDAFIVSFGQGKPVIALLGEYSALAGLSQQAGCVQPISVTPGENGHGCRHSLPGTAAFTIVITIKEWLGQCGQGGAVRFCGCPGEEGGSGKTFTVHERVLDDMNVALTWRPETLAGIFNTRTLTNIQAPRRLKRIVTHATNSPHLGYSALDTVTLMIIGTNFPNEYIIEKAHVHYAIISSGGISSSVAQVQAEVLYLIRAPEMTDVQHVYDRVAKIAEGATLMIETTVGCRFDKICSNCLPNRTLENAMYQILSHFDTPEWSSEELAFTKQIQTTLASSDRQNSLNNITVTGGEDDKAPVLCHRETILANEVVPYTAADSVLAVSTDVGDVNRKLPVTQCFSPCFTVGTSPYTWQLVNQGRTSIAYKEILLATKTMAATTVNLFSGSRLLQECRQEHQQVADTQPYHYPIPKDVTPSPLK